MAGPGKRVYRIEVQYTQATREGPVRLLWSGCDVLDAVSVMLHHGLPSPRKARRAAWDRDARFWFTQRGWDEIGPALLDYFHDLMLDVPNLALEYRIRSRVAPAALAHRDAFQVAFAQVPC